MSKYVLRHGSFVEVSDDELMHWKYIKREKVNGKWRYYYKDDAYDKLTADYNKAKADAERAGKYAKDLREVTKNFESRLNKENGNNYKATDANKSLQGYKATRDKAADEYTNALHKARNLKKQYDNASNIYKDSAGHSVASFLNRASRRIDKAKKWFKGLFS